MSGKPVPSEITRANVSDIRIIWQDGHDSIYPPDYLRFKCPCAKCVDEWTGMRVLKVEEVSEEVAVNTLQLVGRYGMRVYWDDGHSDGIYTFELLRDLCPCLNCRS